MVNVPYPAQPGKKNKKALTPLNDAQQAQIEKIQSARVATPSNPNAREIRQKLQKFGQAPVGPNKPQGKPEPPKTSNGVTPPAPTRADPNKPGFVVTRGPKKDFMAAHPVLASKTGVAKDKFLENHPKIQRNVDEYNWNAKARRDAILRRVKAKGK